MCVLHECTTNKRNQLINSVNNNKNLDDMIQSFQISTAAQSLTKDFYLDFRHGGCTLTQFMSQEPWAFAHVPESDWAKPCHSVEVIGQKSNITNLTNDLLTADSGSPLLSFPSYFFTLYAFFRETSINWKWLFKNVQTGSNFMSTHPSELQTTSWLALGSQKSSLLSMFLNRRFKFLVTHR